MHLEVIVHYHLQKYQVQQFPHLKRVWIDAFQRKIHQVSYGKETNLGTAVHNKHILKA
jgi:hypothetical protein